MKESSVPSRSGDAEFIREHMKRMRMEEGSPSSQPYEETIKDAEEGGL